MSRQAAHLRLVRELATAYGIVAASSSGLLDALLQSDGPIRDVAEATGLDPDGVGRMLPVLEAAGWVEHVHDGWRAADWLRTAECAGLTLARSTTVFAHLGALLADGSVVFGGDVRHDSSGVRGLAQLFGDAPARLAAALRPARGTVLDLGAGSAAWSLAMAVDADCEVVALDRDEVLTAATELAGELGIAGRLRLLPGSFWDVEYPPADRIVIANVVHLLDDEESRALVKRAVAALRPGGELVIVDVLAADPLPPDVAAYALSLRLREPHGQVHRTRRIEAWLADAGLTDLLVVPLEGQDLAIGAVTGRQGVQRADAAPSA